MINEAILYIKIVLSDMKKELTKLKTSTQKTVSSMDFSQMFSGLKDIGKRAQDFREMSKYGIDTSRAMSQLEGEFAHLSSSMGTVFRNAGQVNTQFKKLVKSQKRFSFDFLTFLFAGMMLYRIFGGALRNILDSYRKMIGMNSELNRKVMKLGASWNYLKFSIANALNNPAVFSAIEDLIDVLEWLSDWVQEHPGLTLFLIGLAAALAAFGIVGMALSGWMQFFMMLDKIILRLRNIKGLMRLVNLAARGLAIGIGAYLIWEGFKDFKKIFSDIKTDFKKRLLSLFKPAAGGGLLGWGLAGRAGGLWGIAFGLSFGILLNLFDWAWEENIDDKLIAWFTAAWNYIKAFPARFMGMFRPKVIIDVETDIKIWKGSEKKDWGEKLKNLFSIEPYFGEDSDYRKTINRVNEERKKELENLKALSIEEKVEKIESVRAAEKQLEISTLQGAKYIRQKMGVDALRSSVSELIPEYEEINTALEESSARHRAIDDDLANYKESLENVEIGKLMEDVDLEKINEFKTSLEHMKTPLAEVVSLLGGEEGFYVVMKGLSDLMNLEDSIIIQLGNFNTKIGEGNEILPAHIGFIDTESRSMEILADQTNAAAAAQERLNRAKGWVRSGGKSKFQEWIEDTFSSGTKE